MRAAGPIKVNVDLLGLDSARFFFDLPESLQGYWEAASLEQCDFIAYEMHYSKDHVNDLDDSDHKAIEWSQRAQKPLLLFVGCDSSESIHFPTRAVFRRSLMQSAHKANEFACPPPILGPITNLKLENIAIRKKAKMPIVGFCGNIKATERSSNRWRFFLNLLGYWILESPRLERCARAMKIRIQRGMARIVRTRAIRYLRGSKRISLNCIERPMGMWSPHLTKDRLNQLRQEFLDNMNESDYALCVRGNGNYSFRFYEALACGRIPLFVNTDCVLPFSDVINYKDYVVWVEYDQIARIGDIVADFHEKITPQEFIDRQYACRKLWEDYFSAAACPKQLAEQLERAGLLDK